MANIIFKKNADLDYTPIPNKFIDEYISGANPAFVTVYIMTLRNYFAGISFDTASISAALGLLESDVINAWKYWQNKGIMTFSNEGDTIVLDFEELNSSQNILEEEEKQQKISIMEKPSYTPETIAAFAENDDIKCIFDMAERLFAKQLDFNEMYILTELYDWLMLPLDVIAILLTYCADKNKNMRYVEKTAIDWAEKEITSAEAAEEYISLFDGKYSEIMRAMGIGTIQPVKKQKKFMDKWVLKLKMPIDIITEACERTVMETGKPRFEYADKIIENWHKKNIKTLKDVKAADDEFSKEKAEKAERLEKTKKTAPSKPAKSKFVNYEQRGYDYDKLKKLERELLDKELEED